jgi:hypothetical protein
MYVRLSIALLVMAVSISASGQTAPDATELHKLLNEFLGATTDPAMHERFWADDLIYTRSAGRRISKAEVLRDVRSAPMRKPGDPKTAYSSEDVRIQQYGDTAVVAFLLVGTTNTVAGTQVAKFLNSGTFVRRNGKWQVVNWQSTRVPRTPEASKKEVGELTTALFSAVLNGDTKSLSSIIDTSFVWTHTDGHKQTLATLSSELAAGRLKYSRLENSNVSIDIYGDTAIVRGDSIRQRASIPETPGTGDTGPFTAFYTITFVNQGGTWKAVAMHTSRATVQEK